MKHHLLALTLLLGLSTAQAETLESNITIQLKLLDQNPDPEGSLVRSYSTTTYKTSDFIQLVGKGENFSKGARLLFQSSYGGGGKFIIRDKGREDFVIPGGFTPKYLTRVGTTLENILLKGKRNTENDTNAFKAFGQSLIQLGANSEDTKIQIKGTYNSDTRVILSKDDPTKLLAPFSATLVGIGSFDLTSEEGGQGYSQGTIKYSPPKVIRDK